MGPSVLFLGSSGAVPSRDRDTTSLVLVGDDESVLIDCGGSPIQKLLRAGVPPRTLVRVIITHLHTDHAYGLPSLIQGLLLMRRTAPLSISCREEHVAALTDLLRVFRLTDRTDMFPLGLDPVPAQPGSVVARTGSFTITAAPNSHGSMPNMALRVAGPRVSRPVVYSSDTEPCDAVVALARGADTLIHEATFLQRDRGRFGAHSTAAEAGDIAARAGVNRLILVHIDAQYHDVVDALADEARQRFHGPVEIARELVPYPL